ncbi:MAG: phospholipase D-like domain-containing protein [Elusimicrobiales bacterium]|nr:phospholipase D-like domain-containing protein [Elusimicrobiales bacterium]
MKKIRILLLGAVFAVAGFLNCSAGADAGALETFKAAGTVPAPVMRSAKAASAISAPALVVEPDSGREPVLALINSAKSSIDITIYQISDTQIVNALLAKKREGVEIRVLYNFYSFQKYGKDPNAETIKKFSDAGIAVQKASESFKFTHQKTITVDGRVSLIMGFNLTPAYFAKTRDYGYVTDNTAQVKEIKEVFDADWNYTAVSPSVPSLAWSPVNARAKILKVINSAKHTLVLEQLEALDKECVDAVIAAAARGVKVRFITARLVPYNGTEDSNKAPRDRMNANGVEAKAGTNYYYHSKMMLADYGTAAQTGFIGSINFSSTSMGKNRELGVVFTEPAFLTTINNAFESDWSANPADGKSAGENMSDSGESISNPAVE